MFDNLPNWILALVGAIIVKLLAVHPVSVWQAIAAAFTAFFFGWFFTPPVIALLNAPEETYSIPIAILLALMGEGLAKQLIAASDNPERLIQWIKTFLGWRR